MSFGDEARAFLKTHPETRSVEILFTDINGILRGKHYPVSSLEGLEDKGINIASTVLLLDARGAVGTASLGPGFHGDPDAVFRAIPGTLAPVPWASTPSAQALLTATDLAGTPIYFDPRAVLKRAARPLEEAGLTPVVALETEFFLLEAAEPAPTPAAPPGVYPRLNGPQCLSMEVLYDFEPFIRDIEAACEQQSVPLTSILCEYGDAQFEANLKHVADPVAACDHLVILKRIVKAAARKLGLVASFMAKPLTGDTGSGLHGHVSLLDREGRNIFAGEDGKAVLRHAIGGVLDALPESIALFCPNANSYRRFQAESFVPLGSSWGENHRSVAVRVPMGADKDSRLEHRVAGADACPYLFLAAILAAMHRGITEKIEPGPMTGTGGPVNEDRPFPARWPVALEAFGTGTILPPYIGEAFHDLYLTVKRQEEARYNAEVTDHDQDWYFRTV